MVVAGEMVVALSPSLIGSVGTSCMWKSRRSAFRTRKGIPRPILLWLSGGFRPEGPFRCGRGFPVRPPNRGLVCRKERAIPQVDVFFLSPLPNQSPAVREVLG